MFKMLLGQWANIFLKSTRMKQKCYHDLLGKCLHIYTYQKQGDSPLPHKCCAFLQDPSCLFLVYQFPDLAFLLPAQQSSSNGFLFQLPSV